MSARPYPLDLAALPLGAIVIAVDCWGEQPIALRVIERGKHNVTGRTATGGTMFVGGPLVRRMATAEEAETFGKTTSPAPQANPATPPAGTTMQMELF
ncbi:hypothetical protein [Pleomorphomonas sp. JP5]|uniref:hypothetical protein n=1 Tax=Pleomorphomonas sp. JP5 TaxID=2942998 RepID=UPI0020446915|nr:hypothetical protein [Pleomorphomonas sp. JP5]MCM5556311.1 hypothetical protein [Pleomorphomonas sp. JP5]